MQVIKNILLTLSQGLGKIKPALQHRTPAVQESSSGRLSIYNFTEAFYIVFDLRGIDLYIFENEIPPPPSSYIYLRGAAKDLFLMLKLKK